jgi:hypothetical protein
MTITGLSVTLSSTAGATAGEVAGTANPEVYFSPYYAGDIYIEPGQGQRNYIQGAVRAGIEINGGVGGVFINMNTIYNNAYGIYLNNQGLGFAATNSITIDGNDIDSNTNTGAYFIGLNAARFQHNHDFGGTNSVVCLICTNVSATGNHYESATNGEVLEGQNTWSEDGAHFSGVTNAVILEPYQGVAVNNFTSMGAQVANATGPFLTFTGNASYPALNVMASAELGTGETCESGANVSYETANSPNIWCNSQILLGTQAVVNSADRVSIVNNTNAVTAITLYNPNAGSSAQTDMWFGNSSSTQEGLIQLLGGGNSPANQFRFHGVAGVEIDSGGAMTISAGTTLTFSGELNVNGITNGGTATKYVCADASGNIVVQAGAC